MGHRVLTSITMQGQCDERTFLKSPLVPASKLARLCALLTGRDDPWKLVAGHIKRRHGDSTRFSHHDITQFSLQPRPAECMLNSWATDRPTIGSLYNILVEVGLHDVARYVKKDILGDDTPTLPITPISGDGGRRDSDTVVEPHPVIVHRPSLSQTPLQDGAQSISDDKIPSGDNQRNDVFSFSYGSLAQWTGNFDDRPLRVGGRLIGKGGFGKVYLGVTPGWPQMAVKKLTQTREGRGWKQFVAEITTLANYCHENLLRLLGYSDQGSTQCLVYEYQPCGSVEQRLACKYNQPPLTASQRVVIAQGAARGICHLHNHRHPQVIHRDIKTANILLDDRLKAKVGDFGLARLGPEDPSKTSTFTQELIGTNVYMAPEYMRSFEVSVKTDAYSFGVVLLELLTGLPSYDEKREERDLISHIESLPDSGLALVDRRAGEWEESVAVSMMDLAWSETDHSKCFLQADKRRRPTITEMLSTIESWTH